MKKTLGALFCIVFVFSLVLIPFANADWTMSRADPSNDGVGSGNPVLTPTLLWKSFNVSNINTNVIGVSTMWSTPAVANGVVYISLGTSVTTSYVYLPIGYMYGDVYAFNATTGAEVWDYRDYGTDINPSGIPSPAVVNGVVFFSFGNVVGALNASDGVFLWNSTAYENIISSPTAVGGVVYLGGYNPGDVYALNATNGDSIWNYTTGGGISPSPAVIDGVVYIGSNDWNVYALNATDGSKLWSYETGNEVDSSCAVANGVVYVGSGDGNLYALNAADGAKLWNFTSLSYTSSPAVVGGVVYISSWEGNTYALNAKDGAVLWNSTTGTKIEASPAVVGGVVYVNNDASGILYALNTHSGEQLWNYTLQGSVLSSPAVVNGVLYVGSGDGQVYALGSTSPPPSPTPTPPASPYTLPIIVGVVAVVLVAAVVFLMFKKRRKPKRETNHSHIGEVKE